MITKIKIYAYLFVLLVCFGLSENLIGQTELFTVLPDNVSLNAEQTARLQRIQAGGYAEQIKFVKVGNLPTVQQNGSLSSTIPIENTRYTFKARNFRDFGGGDYSWTGHFANTDHENVLSIRSINGKVFGHAEIDDNFYRLIDMTGLIWAFIKISDGEDGTCGNDDSNITVSSTGISASPLRDSKPPVPFPPTNNSCDDDISVLVLYTRNAKDKEAEMWQLAKDCIEQANDILTNSAVSTNDARFKLQGVRQINMTESDDIERDHEVTIMGYSSAEEWVNNPNATPSSTEANMLRNQYGADCVVVFTDGEYGATVGIAGGNLFAGNDFPQRAFAIVDVCKAMGKRKTFVHELGHIVNLYHENLNGNFYGRGYLFEAGGLWNGIDRKTIMHRLTSNPKKRILHFSNPDVDFKEEPTGTTGANSVRSIRENACTLANFRQDIIPTFTASIGASGSGIFVSTGSSRTYTAYGNNGQEPYQYEWRVSLDGFNYGGIVSTSNQLTNNYSAYQSGDVLFIKIKITSANGQTAEDIFVQPIL